jgi:hypothetical protein
MRFSLSYIDLINLYNGRSYTLKDIIRDLKYSSNKGRQELLDVVRGSKETWASNIEIVILLLLEKLEDLLRSKSLVI